MVFSWQTSGLSLNNLGCRNSACCRLVDPKWEKRARGIKSLWRLRLSDGFDSWLRLLAMTGPSTLCQLIRNPIMLILVTQPCNIRGSFVRMRPAMLRDDSTDPGRKPISALNVLGERLEICSFQPMTGFYRDGCCKTGREDVGSHTVYVVMTAEFLEFSKSRGNDLSTPLPEFGFPGLKPGDRWCLCAPRWQEALEANQAPRVVLRATHEGALTIVRS